ncbi:hypothetical protein [Streptomyces sp. NPDC050145]|uniref:hypothetical protein n=1 Tax=Streptomyces sp. NPDC050145 TaxID=3365602 RepID=UPI0037A53705
MDRRGERAGRHPVAPRVTGLPYRRRSAGRMVLWGCGAVVVLLALAAITVLVLYAWTMGENHHRMFGD